MRSCASARNCPRCVGQIGARNGYTLEQICGEPIRRLAARAQRKGLRFRYEDAELQGLALIGNAARLRRVLANLIDNSLHVCESGELIVHLTLIPMEEREVRLSASVTATGMTDEEAAMMLEPYLVQPLGKSGLSGAITDRRIEFFGVRVMVSRAAAGGITFQFNQRFEADLSRVTIDLSKSVPPSAQPRAAMLHAIRARLRRSHRTNTQTLSVPRCACAGTQKNQSRRAVG